jgi:predicted RNase H-like nuclease (RuvC/YqgF family)
MRASHEDAVTAAYARAGVLPLLPLDDPQLAEVARSFAARDAESVTAHERGYEIRMVAALERAEKWETKAKELAATIVRERGERDLLKHRVAELEQELAVESERRRKAIDERDREREIAHALKRRLDYATAGPGDHV